MFADMNLVLRVGRRVVRFPLAATLFSMNHAVCRRRLCGRRGSVGGGGLTAPVGSRSAVAVRLLKVAGSGGLGAGDGVVSFANRTARRDTQTLGGVPATGGRWSHAVGSTDSSSIRDVGSDTWTSSTERRGNGRATAASRLLWTELSTVILLRRGCGECR